MAWADFGQHVTLTARIREILLNYPEGTSVFKELVQVQAIWPCMHGIHDVSSIPIALPAAAHPACCSTAWTPSVPSQTRDSL